MTEPCPHEWGHGSLERLRYLGGSSTVRNRSDATPLSVCWIPLGQRISTESILASGPSPKCTRLSLEDMKPTLMATWLYNTRPDAVVSLTLAPMASRALLCPTKLSTSQ